MTQRRGGATTGGGRDGRHQSTMIATRRARTVGLERSSPSLRRGASDGGAPGTSVLKLTSTRASSQRPSSVEPVADVGDVEDRGEALARVLVVGLRGLGEAEGGERAGAQLRVVVRVGTLGHVHVDAVQRRGAGAGDALDAQVGTRPAPESSARSREGRSISTATGSELARDTSLVAPEHLRWHGLLLRGERPDRARPPGRGRQGRRHVEALVDVVEELGVEHLTDRPGELAALRAPGR